MYRRILVPIDGSEASLVGLTHAIGLAKEQKSQLRILNVVDDLIMAPILTEPSGAVEFTYVLDSARAEGRQLLQQAAASAAKAGVRAETAQIESRGRVVSDVIVKDAKRSKSELIVMGTHGRRGLNRLLLGSDAERVLRDAPVPVLLTRYDDTRRTAAKAPARKAA